MNKQVDNQASFDVKKVLSQIGLVRPMVLKGGHTQADLYRGFSADNQQCVVKIGNNKGLNDEIAANIFGYTAIAKEGAEALLPAPMTFGEIDYHHYIMMPYLGADIAQRDKRHELTSSEYVLFSEILTSVLADTVREHDSNNEMRFGLETMRAKLNEWFGRLVEKGFATQHELDVITNIDLTLLASNKTSLMIMDFTPDNTFFDREKVSFIDPWKQDIYRGSFVPSLSQFVTLATDIYSQPAALGAESVLRETIQYIGGLLGLTHHQIHAQGVLGSALQYTLSGFVRLESNPEQASAYIEKAKNAIKLLKNDIIQLKEGQ